ncbi:MAG: DNA adenine methylase [Desulforegulaceae bacterium]|nr:DNA adenine methylase [Desulforegulaceae bacterium]
MVKEKSPNKSIAPFVKWVGGKRQLIKDLEIHFPSEISTYYEPFVGGGAVLFHLQPKKAVINDTNKELINLYKTIKNNPDKLIKDLKKHENTPEYFYKIRSLDRDKNIYSKLSKVEKASRIVYLNKTCFNGLYRVNSSGEFNTPFGKYKNPNIVNETTIKAVSNYLSTNLIEILNIDFEKSLLESKEGDFVYLDPPYDPVSNSANFTGYTKSGFGKDEQLRLKNICDNLNKKGVKFLLSNSFTNFIQDLYSDYKFSIINAKRSINSNAKKRGAIKEVLVKNYD